MQITADPAFHVRQLVERETVPNIPIPLTKWRAPEPVRKLSLARWPRLLRRIDLAEYIGFKPSKVDALVKNGKLPQPWYHLSKNTPVWDRNIVDAFLDGLSSEPNITEQTVTDRLSEHRSQKRGT